MFSQPPCPYNMVQKTFNIGGCVYDVNLCVNCNPFNNMVEVKVWGFNKLDPNCDNGLTSTQVLAEIKEQVNRAEVLKNLCTEGFMPCDGSMGYSYFYIAIPICWFKYNINGNIYYNICYSSQDFCIEIWKWCYDNNTGQYQRELDREAYQNGSWEERCSNPEPLVDPLPGEQSSCFYLNTDCNP